MFVRQVDKGSIVRHGFMSTLHKVESFGKEELQLKKKMPLSLFCCCEQTLWPQQILEEKAFNWGLILFLCIYLLYSIRQSFSPKHLFESLLFLSCFFTEETPFFLPCNARHQHPLSPSLPISPFFHLFHIVFPWCTGTCFSENLVLQLTVLPILYMQNYDAVPPSLLLFLQEGSPLGVLVSFSLWFHEWLHIKCTSYLVM